MFGGSVRQISGSIELTPSTYATLIYGFEYSQLFETYNKIQVQMWEIVFQKWNACASAFFEKRNFVTLRLMTILKCGDVEISASSDV